MSVAVYFRFLFPIRHLLQYLSLWPKDIMPFKSETPLHAVSLSCRVWLLIYFRAPGENPRS